MRNKNNEHDIKYQKAIDIKTEIRNCYSTTHANSFHKGYIKMFLKRCKRTKSRKILQTSAIEHFVIICLDTLFLFQQSLLGDALHVLILQRFFLIVCLRFS